MPHHAEKPQDLRICAYCLHSGSTSGTSSIATHSGSPTEFRAWR